MDSPLLTSQLKIIWGASVTQGSKAIQVMNGISGSSSAAEARIKLANIGPKSDNDRLTRDGRFTVKAPELYCLKAVATAFLTEGWRSSASRCNLANAAGSDERRSPVRRAAQLRIAKCPSSSAFLRMDSSSKPAILHH